MGTARAIDGRYREGCDRPRTRYLRRIDPSAHDLEPDRAAVLAANRAFYEAFEAGDIGAVSDLWEHSDRVVCTHPGWRALHGWASVASSFFALLQQEPTQFIITGERVEIVGDLAWVTVEENVLGPDAGDAVSALNLFARTGDAWLMVAHHAAAVARGQ